ncbi:MAG: helix-turn-helix transcriptional regulator [bacterium]|nr:helix-turn-helix transcriptional regulator [bacterium]
MEFNIETILEEFFMVITLLGGGQGIFLVITLLTRKKNAPANRMLALLIFSFTFSLIISYLLLREIDTVYPSVMALTGMSDFLYGPLFYLYIGLLTSNIRSLRPMHLLHFVPALVNWVQIAFFFMMTEGEKQQLIKEFTEQNVTIDYVVSEIVLFIQLIIYAFLILRQFRQYRTNLEKYFTNIDKLNLRWLRILIVFVIMAWMVYLFSFICYFIDFELFLLMDLVYLTLYTIFLYIMGYIALNQPEIFNRTHQMTEELDKISEQQTAEQPGEESEDEEKYKKTKLDEGLIEEYMQKILSYMEETQAYKEAGLTLKELSDRVDIASHHVSQVINSRLNRNFFSFINNYRVEEAKRVLKDPAYEDENILSIAYDVGFNSKPTFNAIFKEYTQMTPTQFRKGG